MADNTMTRAIFVQEFKRSFFQAILVLYPFFFGLLAIERLLIYRPQLAQTLNGTPDAIVDLLMSALLIVSAFVFGIWPVMRLRSSARAWFSAAIAWARWA